MKINVELIKMPLKKTPNPPKTIVVLPNFFISSRLKVYGIFKPEVIFLSGVPVLENKEMKSL